MVELGVLAEGVEGLRHVERDEDVARLLRPRLLGEHALGEDRGRRRDRVDDRLVLVRGELDEPAADPEVLRARDLALGDVLERAREGDDALVLARRRELLFGDRDGVEVAPAVAVPVLPLEERRDPLGLRLRAVEDELDRPRLLERLEPRVAEVDEALDGARPAERREWPARDRPQGLRVVGDLVALDREAALEPDRRDEEVLLGLEDDGLALLRLLGRHLGAARDPGASLVALDEVEGEHRPRGGGRAKADAYEVEEREVDLVRHLVEPVEDHLRHPREELYERDPGVRGVVVRPLGAVLRDEPDRLVADLLERPIVEVRRREHRASAQGLFWRKNG